MLPRGRRGEVESGFILARHHTVRTGEQSDRLRSRSERKDGGDGSCEADATARGHDPWHW